MESLQQYTEKVKVASNSFVRLITKHRFTVLFIILGASTAFALIKTGSYLEISRDEQRYTEETVGIKYKQIDEETLDKFQAANQDEDIQVDSDFDEGRSNPFTN